MICLSLCPLVGVSGLDQYGRLTDPMGVRMAEFPLSPMFAKMLLESGNFSCSKEIVTIAAMMQIQNIFVVPSTQKKAAVSSKRVSGRHAQGRRWLGADLSVTFQAAAVCLSKAAVYSKLRIFRSGKGNCRHESSVMVGDKKEIWKSVTQCVVCVCCHL